MAGAANGGAEIFFGDALAALQGSGVQQYVVTRPDNRERIDDISVMGIAVKTASFSKLWRGRTRAVIQRAIADFKPDIVQYWMGRAASFAVTGDHINIGWYSSKRKIKHFKHCDYHIGVTQDVTDHIITQGVAPEAAFSLPIYTRQQQNVDPVSREALDTPDEAPLLLSLARLHPVKGLDVLLAAMVNIPSAYLWLAGDGELEEALKAQSTALGLDGRVRFLGWRTDKEALMAAADICVFPSRNDSFGAVMIEAWARRVPLVATKAPGPKAYIRHEEDGLLTEIDDAREFAAAVNRIISDPDLAKRLSENGYKRYAAEFTGAAYKKRAVKIYKDIMAR